MSDNVTKVRFDRTDGKRIRVFWIVLVLVILIVGLILFAEQLNLDALGRRITYGLSGRGEDYGVFTFDAHSSNRFAAYGDGLAVASAGGLKAMDADGRTDQSVACSLANPAVCAGGDVTVCYDLGGGSLTAVRRHGGTVLEYETEGGIFDADVASDGAIAVSAAESGYKTVLRVYDGGQKEIYRWFSSSRFLPVCAVSRGGDWLAAVSLGEDGGEFAASLLVFRTGDQDVYRTVDLGDQLVYDAAFSENGRICLVCEDAMRTFTVDGREEGAMELSGRALTDYDLSGDGFSVAAVSPMQAGSLSTVITFDRSGQELGSAELDEEVLDVSAAGKYAAVLTGQALTIYRRDMTEYCRMDNNILATRVLQHADGTAILIAGNSGRLLIP